jgi:hypothetical protein
MQSFTINVSADSKWLKGIAVTALRKFHDCDWSLHYNLILSSNYRRFALLALYVEVYFTRINLKQSKSENNYRVKTPLFGFSLLFM